MATGNKSGKKQRGWLSSAFRDTALTSLQAAFWGAASVADKPVVAQALAELHRTAQQLRVLENAFNNRARHAGNSIMKHLRDKKHFDAMRSFSAAKEKLFELAPPEKARHMVQLLAQGAKSRFSAVSSQPKAPASRL